MGGTFSSFLKQSFPPKSKFSVSDIPDLSGKVIIVTGGNIGIGYETARALLPRNAKVYLACRSKSKAEAAIKALKDDTGKEAFFLQLDLADIKGIRRSVAGFKECDRLVSRFGVWNNQFVQKGE